MFVIDIIVIFPINLVLPAIDSIRVPLEFHREPSSLWERVKAEPEAEERRKGRREREARGKKRWRDFREFLLSLGRDVE